MPFKTHPGIGLGHALAIVDHLNQRPTRIPRHQLHRRGPRIDRILQQFLHHRRRPLNNLASGNLVGNGIGQKVNDILHKDESPDPARRQ